MSNEAQYYHPIIQAMLARRQNEIEEERIQNAAKSDKAHLALEEQAGTRAQSELQHKHDYEDKMTDIQSQLLKLHTDAQHADELRKAGEAVRGGTLKVDGLPRDDQGNINLPGVGSVNPNVFSNPSEAGDQAARNAGKVAGAQTTGQLQAAQPFEEMKRNADFSNRLAEDKLNHAQRLDELAKQAGYSQDLERVRGGFQQATKSLEGANRLKEIQALHSLNLGDGTGDPVQLQDRASQMLDGILVGQRSYSSLSKDEKLAVDRLADSRHWTIPTDQKVHALSLNQAQSGQKVLDLAQDLANNNSVDQSGGGFKNVALNGQIPGIVPVSDLNRKKNALTAEVGNLTTTLDQAKRLNDPEVRRKLNGLFDASANKEQNLANIKSIQDLFNTQQGSPFRGLPNDEQNYISGKLGLTRIGGYGQPGQPTAPAPTPGGPTPAPVVSPKAVNNGTGLPSGAIQWNNDGSRTVIP